MAGKKAQAAAPLSVVMVPLGNIKPYPGNPWCHDEASVAGVAESIRRYGFRQPIVTDVEHVIIVGHGRFLAAQRLGLTEVPVHVAADLSQEQARAYRLADNGTHQLGRWDMPALSLELAALSPLNLEALGVPAPGLSERPDEEHREDLRPMKRLHILLSVSVDHAAGVLPKLEAIAAETGGTLHHGGN